MDLNTERMESPRTQSSGPGQRQEVVFWVRVLAVKRERAGVRF